MNMRAFLWGLSTLSFVGTSWAMEEDFVTTKEIFLDGGTAKEQIGLFNYPQIGVYATPYHFATPLLAMQSKEIISLIPESILKDLMSRYHAAGTPEEIAKNLSAHIASRELTVALVVLKGLANNPPVYNVVFHPIVAGWLGKPMTASVNETISAAIFNANGVQPASESIAFNAMGPLAINLHDVDNYSPNNGRFAVESQREVETFWVMGALHNHATVAYIMLITDQALQKEMQEIVATISTLGKAFTELEGLISNFERIAKQLESQGKAGDFKAIADAIFFLKALAAKTAVSAEPAKPIESPKITPLPLMPPSPLPQKPVARKLSLVPAAEIDTELDDLYQELQMLEHAISD